MRGYKFAMRTWHLDGQLREGFVLADSLPEAVEALKRDPSVTRVECLWSEDLAPIKPLVTFGGAL